jgi:hypothetical protein
MAHKLEANLYQTDTLPELSLLTLAPELERVKKSTNIIKPLLDFHKIVPLIG